MIDVYQLTSLISAFRVETEKESISPETVGKLLQDIVDLLATASTDAEHQILDDWKTMLYVRRLSAWLKGSTSHSSPWTPWPAISVSSKYYATVVRTKEFFHDSIGRSITGIIADLIADFAGKVNNRTQNRLV